ncbi:unnamed protein product [Brugia pahangi]|uniref:Secreted protein n=1 Tax=Brugia pahangi TaxID=6280 RepID=A0A0N4SZT0_BRUPA|nr:unnamed protein product [Brugia pahangi]
MQASRSDSGSIITLLTLYLLSWVGCEDVQGQLPTPLSPCSPSVSLIFLSSLPLIKSPIRLFPGPMSSGSRSRSPTNIFPFTNSVIRPH